MALDNREAAKELLIAGRYRSCVSRSYYAAYCAFTSLLEGRVDFAHGGNNPSHEGLEALAFNNLYEFSLQERHLLRKEIRRLRKMRDWADYTPQNLIESGVARDSLRSGNAILRIVLEEK